MVIYRTKFVLECGQVFYYVGKDMLNNKKYIGSGKLIPWFKNNSIYIQKTIIDRAKTKEELTRLENYWLQKLNCCKQYNYLNIKGYSSGGSTVTDKQKWLIALRLSIPKRIQSYKNTRKKWNIIKRNQVSANISKAVRQAIKAIPQQLKNGRKLKEMNTKNNRSKEQKIQESYLKSEASKRAAESRRVDPAKHAEYCQKVSNGVKSWYSTRSTEEIINTKFKYKKTMYSKNKMLDFEYTVREMIADSKSSLDIYHFIKSKGINTHHICVKKYIDFLKMYSII
jgi:hypothetical protein